MNMLHKGHEHFISRMQDLFIQVRYGNQSAVTSFLTLPEQTLLQSMLPSDLKMELSGGFEGAERKRACIMRADSFDKPDFQICLLQASYPGQYVSISHPDLLGALMHAGLEREVLGDFICKDSTVTIACADHLSEYVAQSASLIRHTRLDFKPAAPGCIAANGREMVEVNTASLRLDAVIAALAHTSRSKAMDMIKAGLVKVNDVAVEQNGTICNNDFVSIRRCGRFYFAGVKNTTRKNRLVLLFEKYM